MKSKIKSNKIIQKYEDDYRESHPFSPKILDNDYSKGNLYDNNDNNYNHINNSNEENKNKNKNKNTIENSNEKKIPIYEKLYK
jgi:hypothetical protein